MAGRGRRGPARRRGPPRDYPEAEALGTKELELEGKTITIDLKSNEQGKFVKIIETHDSQSRGRVILSASKASELRSILNEFIAEHERLTPAEENSESERLKSETFTQGRRRYFIDLRQNQRGRFLKISMLAGNKTFVAIPAEAMTRFRDNLAELLDTLPAEDSGGEGGGARPPPQRAREQRSSPAATTEKILPSKEVRAGGKRFYFDVDQNDRGTFIRLSEVLNTGRRNRINIPQSCWAKMSDTFDSYAKDMPYALEEDSTGTGSEDN